MMMVLGTRLGRLAGSALLMLAFASASAAATYTLDDLVNGGQTFTSDNGLLTFSDFAVSKSKGLSSDLTLYTVTTLADGFSLSSAEFDAQTGGMRKLDFEYFVTSTGGAITGASMVLNGSASSGRAKVEKDIEDSGSDQGTFLIAQIRGSDLTDTDSDTFSPGASVFEVEEQIRIKKVATLGSIDDSFTVPEPTGLSLLAAGLSGLAWLGRKRARRA